MTVSDEDPAFCVCVRFKTTFKKDLAERQADMNNEWLKLASALEPDFKDLKCLSMQEREQVWASLENPQPGHNMYSFGNKHNFQQTQMIVCMADCSISKIKAPLDSSITGLSH